MTDDQAVRDDISEEPDVTHPLFEEAVLTKEPPPDQGDAGQARVPAENVS